MKSTFGSGPVQGGLPICFLGSAVAVRKDFQAAVRPLLALWDDNGCMKSTFGSGPMQGGQPIRVLGVAVAVGQGKELADERDDPRLGGQVEGGEALVLPRPPAVQDASHHADVALRCCQLRWAVAIPILQH